MSTLIPLKFPIKSATGATISSLTLRRGKRKDIAAAAKHSDDPAEQEDFLMARLTDLTLEDIGELDISDSKQLTDSFRDMVDGIAAGDAKQAA